MVTIPIASVINPTTTNGRANIHATDTVTSVNGNDTTPHATVIPAPITRDKNGHTY